MSGSNADQWIPAAPGSEGTLALALARAVFEHLQKTGRSIPGDARAVEQVLGRVDRGKAASSASAESKWRMPTTFAASISIIVAWPSLPGKSCVIVPSVSRSIG